MLVGLERFRGTLEAVYLVCWERGNGDVHESEALVQPTSTPRILSTSQSILGQRILKLEFCARAVALMSLARLS